MNPFAKDKGKPTKFKDLCRSAITDRHLHVCVYEKVMSEESNQ